MVQSSRLLCCFTLGRSEDDHDDGQEGSEKLFARLANGHEIVTFEGLAPTGGGPGRTRPRRRLSPPIPCNAASARPAS